MTIYNIYFYQNAGTADMGKSNKTEMFVILQ